uniref:Uncharacterized protein n=1 Tax=Glossina austeni TaxID=7395 RepID=A0A1A9VR81_GLOAU
MPWTVKSGNYFRSMLPRDVGCDNYVTCKNNTLQHLVKGFIYNVRIMLISCRQWHSAAMLRIIKFLFGGRALQWQSGAVSITAASEASHAHIIAVWLVMVIEDIICGGGGGSSSNSLKCNTFTPPTGGVCVFVIAPMPPLFATPLPQPTAMPTTVAAVADLNVAYSPSSISPVALIDDQLNRNLMEG